jgi:hypothetical protein
VLLPASGAPPRFNTPPSTVVLSYRQLAKVVVVSVQTGWMFADMSTSCSCRSVGFTAGLGDAAVKVT